MVKIRVLSYGITRVGASGTVIHSWLVMAAVEDLKTLLENPPHVADIFHFHASELGDWWLGEKPAKRAMSRWVADVSAILRLYDLDDELSIWQEATQEITADFEDEERKKVILGRIIARLEEADSPDFNSSSYMTMIRIFISHSSKDEVLAELIVDLLRSALNLKAEAIRCTSVEGHRLPGGANTNEQLRRETLASPAFIGLVSKASMESAYVLFELGARWGAEKHLLPLLAPGVSSSLLRGPLANINALRCDSPDQLHQLVHDVAKVLDLQPEKPHVYHKKIDKIQSYAAEKVVSDPVSADMFVNPGGSVSRQDEFADAETTIEDHCVESWPDDFSMREYCEKKQREALNELKRGSPEDVPADIFSQIRAKCASEWPTDFSMRLYCEKKQLESYRTLHDSEG